MKISIKHLEKFYAKKKVLDDFSAEILLEGNNIYGILGPNGAGKTTFLKVLSGILSSNNGNISVDDNDEKGYEKWAKNNVAFIFSGERGLRLKNTVYDNVIYYGILKGSNIKEIKENIVIYSKLLEIQPLLNRRIEELSTGQKKKAAILCGLCSNMKLMILDEPSIGLDIDSIMELKNVLLKVTEEVNTTLIISSHDIEFLSDLCQKYIFIFNGKNVFESNIKMEEESIKKAYKSMKERWGDDERLL